MLGKQDPQRKLITSKTMIGEEAIALKMFGRRIVRPTIAQLRPLQES